MKRRLLPSITVAAIFLITQVLPAVWEPEGHDIGAALAKDGGNGNGGGNGGGGGNGQGNGNGGGNGRGNGKEGGPQSGSGGSSGGGAQGSPGEGGAQAGAGGSGEGDAQAGTDGGGAQAGAGGSGGGGAQAGAGGGGAQGGSSGGSTADDHGNGNAGGSGRDDVNLAGRSNHAGTGNPLAAIRRWLFPSSNKDEPSVQQAARPSASRSNASTISQKSLRPIGVKQSVEIPAAPSTSPAFAHVPPAKAEIGVTQSVEIPAAPSTSPAFARVPPEPHSIGVAQSAAISAPPSTAPAFAHVPPAKAKYATRMEMSAVAADTPPTTAPPPHQGSHAVSTARLDGAVWAPAPEATQIAPVAGSIRSLDAAEYIPDSISRLKNVSRPAPLWTPKIRLPLDKSLEGNIPPTPPALTRGIALVVPSGLKPAFQDASLDALNRRLELARAATGQPAISKAMPQFVVPWGAQFDSESITASDGLTVVPANETPPQPLTFALAPRMPAVPTATQSAQIGLGPLTSEPAVAESSVVGATAVVNGVEMIGTPSKLFIAFSLIAGVVCLVMLRYPLEGIAQQMIRLPRLGVAAPLGLPPEISATRSDVPRNADNFGPTIGSSQLRAGHRVRTSQLATCGEFVVRALPHIWAHTDDDNRRAIELLKEALAYNSVDVQALALESWCHAQRASYLWSDHPKTERKNALDLAYDAVKHINNSATALNAVGAALSIAGRDQKLAASFIERALEIDQKNALSWVHLGWASHYAGFSLRAVEHFERAFRLSPSHVFAFSGYIGLGEARATLGDTTTGISLIQRGLRKKPTATWAYGTLAWLYTSQGDNAKAAEAVRMLRVHHPSLTVELIEAGTPPSILMRRSDYLAALQGAGLPCGHTASIASDLETAAACDA